MTKNRENEKCLNGEKKRATSVITCNSLQSLRLNEFELRHAFPLLFPPFVRLNRYDRNFVHLMIICVIPIDTNAMLLHSKMCNQLFLAVEMISCASRVSGNSRLNACNANLIQVLNTLFLFHRICIVCTLA